jgi:hypothetical protein
MALALETMIDFRLKGFVNLLPVDGIVRPKGA